MKALKGIIEGDEYYFYFNNYFCSGYVIKVAKHLLYIKNGCFAFPQEEEYAYKEATIDIRHLIGFASV